MPRDLLDRVEEVEPVEPGSLSPAGVPVRPPFLEESFVLGRA